VRFKRGNWRIWVHGSGLFNDEPVGKRSAFCVLSIKANSIPVLGSTLHMTLLGVGSFQGGTAEV
jgi:hypothetical protein